ncbi:MAG: 1,4-dihydroxy-2-naphthoate polyprenyltransferase [Cyclobacteriaceae bacterium]|nr:1,4-dihydroxy-2-naphthoate polyprenyltransferase [Cyclobacteriaceae bacterium]
MMKHWIEAFRLRTLPLSLACIGMGSFLAAAEGRFQWSLFALACLTTIFLQVLSNLANDYGDSIHGADHAERLGPKRAVQSGKISSEAMRRAVALFAGASFLSGCLLLYIAFGFNWQLIGFFLGLGLLSILAAVGYTVGKKPYGYLGLGDLSVFLFFGLVGVMGTYFLFTREFNAGMIWPAMSCGFFSIAVLNINNIRDMESDRQAGKFSIPVRLGKRWAVRYHIFLLAAGLLSAIVYTLGHYTSGWQFIFLAITPLLVVNGRAAANYTPQRLDPYLRQMALSTLLFVVLFGAAQLIF